MKSRRQPCWPAAVAVIAMLAETCAVHSPRVFATETCKTVAELLSSTGSETPPLPPRQTSAAPVAAATPDGNATTTVFQMVVQTTPQSVREIPDHGWQSGRVRIDELSATSVAESSATASGESSTQVRQSAATSTVVVSDVVEETRTQLTSAVFPSEVVFDGVAVLADSLAPFPTSPFDIAEATPLSIALAPQTLELSSTTVVADLAPTPVDVGTESAPMDEPAAADAKSPAAVGQVDALHKPLAAVTLSTGLFDREPPDQSATRLPNGAPAAIWGAPWPTTNLACYRYSVPFHHRPLYFEQPNFERCGVSCGVFSPYVSAANFAGNVVLLPLHMLLDPPCTCVPTLGDCTACERFGLCPHLNLPGN